MNSIDLKVTEMLEVLQYLYVFLKQGLNSIPQNIIDVKKASFSKQRLSQAEVCVDYLDLCM